MSDDIPQTADEITSAIKDEWPEYLIYEKAELIGEMIVRWREAWLRDSVPRLRPVTETPQLGDTIIALYEDASPTLWKWKSNGNRAPIFGLGCTGWYLIKRATVPLTHKDALRLLVSNIRSLGSPPEQLLVALAKAEEALAGAKP